MIFGRSGVVIAPSASVLAPLIRGEPDIVGLLLGSRELLWLSSRISRTLVSCSSLSELYLPAEGLGTSRRRRVTQGPDTSSRPLIGTGAQHVMLLPPDRGATPHVVAAYQGTLPSLRLSVGKLLPSPIQPVVPIPSESFFFLTDSPY